MIAIGSELRLGISAASSWAWGTSLVVGMEIAQTKGLMAWAIWAAANTAALAVFGLLAPRIRVFRAFDRPFIRAGALLIQLFILVIQLNILASLAGGVVATLTGFVFATLTGFVFVLMVYKRGLFASILSDNVLLPVVMLALVCMVCTGILYGVPRTVYPQSGTNDILWGFWGAMILLSGPIGDAQHWQRASRRAYFIGSLFFGVYMLLILFVSSFQFNAFMHAFLLVAVFCLTGSTMDSSAVALHALVGKQTGVAMALTVCVLWPLLAGVGILELWSKAGAFRVLFAMAVLALAFGGMRNEARKDRD